MDEDTTKIIKEKFDALPKEIQEVILSSNYEETLLEIGKQYNLNVEQLGILEREATLVMMGLTPTKNFEAELTHELNLDKTKGAQIVKDINEKIFLKIRSLLKLMNTPIGEEPSLEEMEENQIPVSTEEGKKPASTESSLGGDDTKILNSAGIQIIPASPAGGPADNEKEEKFKKDMDAILTKKLSTSVQNPMVRTEHTLDNITKSPSATASAMPKPAIPPSGVMGTIKPASTETSKLSPSYQRGADPYRMKPE